MIDLSYQPYESGARVESLPKMVIDAASGDFPKQREALKNLNLIQREGVLHMAFISTFREVFLIDKDDGADDWNQEFNKLQCFLSSVTKACTDTISLVEQDDAYGRHDFLDSSLNMEELAQMHAAAAERQAETAQ